MKDYVLENHGEELWDNVCKAAAIDNHIYLTIDTYEDEELIRIFNATADQLGVAVSALLEAYGRFAVGRLLKTCRDLIDDDWDVFDLIANTDDQILDNLRTRDPNLNPPELVCRRDDAEQVTVKYSSDRQLCAMGKGIIHGIGARFDVRLAVTETSCMHDGADYCEFIVTRPATYD